MFREFLDKGLKMGRSESLCKEQSQITLFKSPLIRPRTFANRNSLNRGPRILGQRAGKGVARVCSARSSSLNQPFQITINSLPVYMGFNTEHPRKKRKINYCNRCTHDPFFFLRYPPSQISPFWKPPIVYRRLHRHPNGDFVSQEFPEIHTIVTSVGCAPFIGASP